LIYCLCRRVSLEKPEEYVERVIVIRLIFCFLLITLLVVTENVGAKTEKDGLGEEERL